MEYRCAIEFIDDLQVVELRGEPCVEIDWGWIPVWLYEEMELEDWWTDDDELIWRDFMEMEALAL